MPIFNRVGSLPLESRTQRKQHKTVTIAWVSALYFAPYFGAAVTALIIPRRFSLENTAPWRRSLFLLGFLSYARLWWFPYLWVRLSQWEDFTKTLWDLCAASAPFLFIEFCLCVMLDPWAMFWQLLKLTMYLVTSGIIVRLTPFDTKHKLYSIYCRVNSSAIYRRDNLVREMGGLVRRLLLHQRHPVSVDDDFKYTPLHHTSENIRLLKIERSVIGDIFCEIKEYSLIDKSLPTYQAVSYHWGDPERMHPVYIREKHYNQSEKRDDRKIQRLCVTKNAFLALRAIRSWWRPRWVWIDSICINQNDAEEKSEQVKVMHEIYSQAYQTMVWLGESDDAHLAFPLLSELIMVAPTKMAVENITEYLAQIESPRWRALSKLARCTWYDRVWVIQEIAEASKVVVQYGQYQFDWQSFEHFANSTFASPQMWRILFRPQEGFKNTSHNMLHLSLFRNMVKEGRRPSLFKCLELTQWFQATDGRDIVYALQNICPPGPSKIKPDYTETTTVEDVYIMAARLMLLDESNRNRLAVIAFAGIGHPRQSPGLPTWVPEWGSCRWHSTLTTSGNLRPHSSYDYRAAGDTEPVISWGISGHKSLGLAGFFVDDIVTLSTSSPPSFQWDMTDSNEVEASTASLNSWMSEALGLAGVDKHPGYAKRRYIWKDQSMREAFWRTCMGDRLLSSEGVFRPAPQGYESYFWAYQRSRTVRSSLLRMEQARMRSEMEFWALLGSDPSLYELAQRCGHLGTGPSNNALPSIMEDLQKCQKYEAVLGPHIYGRRFSLTRSGYMGLVPPNTFIGDRVCVVFGAQTPIILRASDQIHEQGKAKYKLIGECYVHGLMDGEAFEMMLEEQTFDIF